MRGRLFRHLVMLVQGLHFRGDAELIEQSGALWQGILGGDQRDSRPARASPVALMASRLPIGVATTDLA